MKVVNVTHELTSIPLGRLGENERTMVIFDVQDWLDEYPGVTIGLYNQLPNESTSYPAVITQPTDGKVTWMVSATELQIVGNGRCELVAVMDDVVVKGVIYKTIVYDALDGAGDAPEPWESWMTEFTRLKGDAETAANTSEAYAVGTKNGVPVESTDPAYENNSKYYAEQAASDAEDANAAKIAAEAAQLAAETAQGKAEDAQEAAEDAQTAAETAQGAAESAQTAAETAQGKAEDAQEAAETAQGKAEDAQEAAEAAQDAAEDAQEAAETAQTATEAAAQQAAEILYGKASATVSPIIENNYPEEIKTLENCADDMGMGFVIPINPVQDLHGYANPWPGGAGKNKVAEIFEDEVRINSSGYAEEDPDSKAICVPGSMFIPVEGLKTYTLSGKNLHKSGNKTNIKVRVALYSSKSALGFSYYNEFDTGDSITLTDSLIPGSGTHYYMISVGADASDVMLENKNGPATDYEPYANICPISGFTGVDITRTGANLFTDSITSGKTIDGQGVIAINVDRSATLNGMAVEPNAEYIMSYTSPSVRNGVFYYKNDGTFISYLAWGDNPRKFTTPANCGIVRFSFDSATVPTNPILWASTTTNITFPSEAGTVYGGTVTINEDGSGRIVADVAISTITGSASGVSFDSGSTRIYLPSSLFQGIKGAASSSDLAEKSISNQYDLVTLNETYSHSKIGYGVSATGNVYIYNPALTSLEAWKASFDATNLQIVYELASPVSYDLTPQQITSLFGTNTVWNSIGTFSMSYHIDPKIYVDDTAGIAGSIAVTDGTAASVKSLSDGADNLPMQVEVAINPVQDLHGQDAPYPAGAGKNLIEPIMATGSINGITCTNNGDGSFTLNGTSTGVATFRIDQSTRDGSDNLKDYSSGDYTVSGLSNSIRLIVLKQSDSTAILEFTGNGTLNIASDKTGCVMYLRVASGNTLNNVTVKPMLEKGSSASEWMPYSNVCPISGWDSVQITRTGKNLLNYGSWKNISISNGTAVFENNGITLTATNGDCYTGFSNTAFPESARIPVKKGQTVTISWEATENNNGNVYIFPNGSVSGSVYVSNANAKKLSYVVPAGVTYVSFRFGVTVSGVTIHYKNIQIEYGSDATSYENYQPIHVYPITFPSTVYGGTLTVNKDGSGRIVCDKGIADLGDFAWDYYSSGTDYPYFSAAINNAKGSAQGVCSIYKKAPVGASTSNDKAWTIISNGANLRVRDSAYTSASEFATAVTGQKLVYELATPIVMDFTAQQIRSLLGTVNLWADSGNVLNVAYYADTKMYIDNLFSTIVNGTGVSF